MLFNNEKAAEQFVEDLGENQIYNTLYFDFNTKSFPIVDGSPVAVSGLDSVAEFVKTIVHVDRGKKAIYDDNFGADLKKIIGKKIKDGFELSQIYQKISDSAKKCAAIDAVEGFRYENNTIYFTVRTKSGDYLKENIYVGGDF